MSLVSASFQVTHVTCELPGQLVKSAKTIVDFLLNSKLRVWPPDLPDLVNYNYVTTFLFKYPTTHIPRQTPTFHTGNVCKHVQIHVHIYTGVTVHAKSSHSSQEPDLVARH